MRGGVKDASDAAAPSPHSTIHGQHGTHDFGATQTHAEGEPLAPALSTSTVSTDDTSDNEMAPPRVTRPLPPAPVPLAPDVSTAPATVVVPVPPPPLVPKRTSLPPPARTVPVPAAADSPPLTQGFSPQRVPPPKRASLLPPSREIPFAAPDSLDVALQRRQPPTKRTSLSPPTRAVPSPSISREGSLVTPPPPPPPSFGYAAQEPWEPGQIKEALQGRDELIAPPPPVLPPSRKPSIRPPTPDGRRSMESRRSTDSRPSHEERRGSGQYAMAASIAVPGPISPPARKRASSSHPLEQELLDDNFGDPIDPRFHTPSRSPIPFSEPPTGGAETLSSASPATPSPAPPASESGGHEELKRRNTIAERMAKLGGIKFGAPPPPPPVSRVQISTPAQPAEDEGAEGNTAIPAQPAPEEEEEEDEQARRQRITAKLAGMGGMRFGMLPIQPGMGVVPPPPPIPTQFEEEATPRSPPRGIARYPESDQECEHPSSSDDGVHVEAEESELEEVLHEDLEDEYGVEDVEEEMLGTSPPPPPPPRSTRPPIPAGRPPPIPPIGRRPSLEATLASGRTGSFETITSAPRPPARQGTSDFVMVEAEEAQLAHPASSSRGLQTLPSVPQSLEPSDLAASGQWEQPSILSGSLDLHDSGDLSASRWSEDSTTYPPAAPSSTRPPPPASGQPRAPHAAAAISARVTADELRAMWLRVGMHVAEAALDLFERSKRTLVGTGSYEGFIAEALAQVPNAAPPRHPGEYGFLIYAQTGAQVHTRLTDIMPGDVVVLEGAKLKGHKGLQTYSKSVGEASPCMGVVSEFDAKKLKLRALQANRRVGQATVELISYRLEDLKSGTIKVYRVQEA